MFEAIKHANHASLYTFAKVFVYLEYICLLGQFWCDDSSVKGSKHQSLFGFRVLGEDHYFAPKHTPLYDILSKKSVTSEGSADSHSYDEFTWWLSSSNHHLLQCLMLWLSPQGLTAILMNNGSSNR